MSYADRTLQQLLDDVAARTSAPGGGAIAAVTAAQAAALVGMAAGFAATDRDGQVVEPEVVRVRDRAGELAGRALELADADARAYEAVLDAVDPDVRADALRDATDIPLEVVEVASETAQLAAPLAHGGRPALRGDAQVGLLVAVGAARAAAHLVRCNVEAGGLDRTAIERADRAVAAAAAVAEAAGGTTP